MKMKKFFGWSVFGFVLLVGCVAGWSVAQAQTPPAAAPCTANDAPGPVARTVTTTPTTTPSPAPSSAPAVETR